MVIVVSTSNASNGAGRKHMTTVSIIGSGNMGTAIASIVAAGGNTAEFVGRDTTERINGDIVVLAVPHTALDEIVAGDLHGGGQAAHGLRGERGGEVRVERLQHARLGQGLLQLCCP